MTISTNIERTNLNRKEQRALLCLASGILYPDTGDYDHYIEACKNAVLHALSEATIERLRRLSRKGSTCGVVVLGNLPYDRRVTRGLVDPERELAGKPSDLSEAILTGVVALMGDPYAILLEGKGMISHLSPKKTHLNSDTGIGALRELSTHVENAAARLISGDRAPDGLALIGVSKEPGISPGTIVADGRLAFALLTPEQQATLLDPTRFRIRFPKRWRDRGFTVALNTAIVRPDADGISFVAALYGELTTALDDEAQAALDAFGEALRIVSIDLRIEPGQLALIDNHITFHGRRAFEPRFDKEGRPYRLLQRLFWISSLDRFGDWPRVRGRLVLPTI